MKHWSWRRRLPAGLAAMVLILAGCAGEPEGLPSDGWDESDSGFIQEIEEIDDTIPQYDGMDEEEPSVPEVRLEQFDIAEEDARLLLTPENGVVTITTRNQLAALSVLVNTGDADYGQYDYELGNNISLAGYDFTPIGGGANEEEAVAFNASFDGNGHIISGLAVRENGFAYGSGLFGLIGPEGVVRRTHVIEAEVRGQDYVGGFVGRSLGTLYDCSYRGTVASTYGPVGGFAGAVDGGTAELCAGNAVVSGSGGVGGLAGQTGEDSLLTDCYALGSVSAVEGDHGAEARWIGGLVGSHQGLLKRAFCVTEVYTNVSSSLVGGAVGNLQGEMESCYFREDIVFNWKVAGNAAEEEEVPGITGLTVEEITEAETFEGWDFEMTWDISESSNRGLPFLR